MSATLKLLTLFLLLCSHLPLFWPSIRALKGRQLPRSIDFVGLSFLLYFDLEIAFEAFGGRYSSEFFQGMFFQDNAGLAIGLLLIAPWAMKLGYLLVRDLVPTQPATTTPRLRHTRIFYALALTTCLGICAFSIFLVASASAIWTARSFIKEYLGVSVIVFYIPTGILGFYACQPESRTKWGGAFTIGLMLMAIVAFAPVGERILIFTPILIVVLFLGRSSLTKVVVIGTTLIIAAIPLLWIMKGYSSENTVGDLGYTVLSGDLARGPSLAASLDNSPPIGSSLLPYPGAGYVYSALYYVPRSLLPFKGYATPMFFTARIVNERAEDLDWGFGISAIEELALNFGWLAVPFGMFIYGVAFALLDLASLRIPVLKVASLFSAGWLMGYSLPVLIGTFGTVSLFGSLCQLLFTRRRRAKPSTLVVRPLAAHHIQVRDRML